MGTKATASTKAQQWVEFSALVREWVPSLASWWASTEDFGELRLKANPDGTILAIAKGYDSDGGPVVAFGTGYDPVAAILAIDGTIQGGRWRFDEPWESKNK